MTFHQPLEPRGDVPVLHRPRQGCDPSGVNVRRHRLCQSIIGAIRRAIIEMTGWRPERV